MDRTEKKEHTLKTLSAARQPSGLVVAVAVLVSASLALATGFTTTAGASTGKVPVTVRAVTWKGEILFDREVRAGTTRVPTSRRATCLGGTPSNGSVTVPGATALGALQQAAQARKPRLPLLLTNAFDFGLGVCGIGNRVAAGEQWWELTVNHRPSTLGGEGTKLEPGDEVLWYLSETFNETSPDELHLVAPETAVAGRPFTVRVLAYNDRGRPRPVEGARVPVAGSALTDARGETRITLRSSRQLVARATSLIPSGREMVRVVKPTGRVAP
jgi:hypothetical protein